MKNLSDEILNKYIDNELSAEENEIIIKILKNSPVDKAKYTELKKIDEGLKKITPVKTSQNFTSGFMERLHLRTIRNKKQKRFIIFISSFLVTAILALSGTALYEVIRISFGNTTKIPALKNLFFNTSFITKGFENIFAPDKISLLGISLSFVLFISLFFLIDEIRKTKHRLNKIG
ncbi:MAG TPA: hypothetical protein ENI76_07625 [Ignavibacteria bacterium]|nr:hypothetical protein [Ignavibacteria bacterium]